MTSRARWIGRTFSLLLVSLPSTAAVAQANAKAIGRWDLTVRGEGRTFPSWLEVSLSGNRTLVGHFVGGGGSARPISEVLVRGDTVRFAIPPQWEGSTAPMQFEGLLRNDRLEGTMITPSGVREPFTGVRAPLLRRSGPVTWDAPITLFDGRSMEAWTALPGTSNWEIRNGILTNAKAGANLATKAQFTDFRLQLEFRYPPRGNSGVYLRGRYEVQVEDTRGLEPQSTHLGGIYGFLTPNQDAARPAGEWQTLDITLIGRRVTVVLNGQSIIVDQTIPGITGGALDSNEGAPGPIYLQGDHTAVEYRSIRLTPAKSSARN